MNHPPRGHVRPVGRNRAVPPVKLPLGFIEPRGLQVEIAGWRGMSGQLVEQVVGTARQDRTARAVLIIDVNVFGGPSLHLDRLQHPNEVAGYVVL